LSSSSPGANSFKFLFRASLIVGLAGALVEAGKPACAGRKSTQKAFEALLILKGADLPYFSSKL